LRVLPCAESSHETVRLLSADGELVAVVEWRQERWYLTRVL